MVLKKNKLINKKTKIMKFKLKFYNDEDYIVSTSSAGIGIKQVDQIRNEVGAPNLKLEKINDTASCIVTANVTVDVTEEIARRSGLFLETALVDVNVNYHFLNKFYIIDYDVKKNDETGEVEEVRAVWKLNEKALLMAWEDAGFPSKWEDEEEEE